MCNVCSEHAHQWLWRGPQPPLPVTAVPSNRKSTRRRQEPPLVCRHWWGLRGSWSSCGHPSSVGSTVMAVPSLYKDGPRASIPVLLAIFTNSRLSFSFFLLSVFKQITAGLLRLQWNTITKKLVRAKRKPSNITNKKPTNKNLSF